LLLLSLGLLMDNFKKSISTDFQQGQIEQASNPASQAISVDQNGSLPTGDSVAPKTQSDVATGSVLTADQTDELKDTAVGDTSNLDAALTWGNFGLCVTPVLPGGLQHAAAIVSLPGTDFIETYRAHWGLNPEHEVAFKPGNGLVVVSTNGEQAKKAFFGIAKASDSFPNVILKSPSRVANIFKLGEGVYVAPNSYGDAANCIEVTTGDTLVMLPPNAATEVALCQADNATELAVASQAMLDAVTQYNACQVKVSGSMVAAAETGESSDVAHAKFAAPQPAKAGDSGETGAPNRPVATDTAFATFSAFAGQPANETSPEVLLAIPVAGAGNIGVDQGVAAKAATEASEALHAPSMVVSTPPATDAASVQPFAEDDDVLTPKALENPIVAAFQARDMYITPQGSGVHEVICPRHAEHGEGRDAKATYSEPDDRNVAGVFTCSHNHVERYSTKDLLDFLGVGKMEARHKASIRVADGELNRIIEASELVLAGCHTHYQSGGMIVSVSTDPSTGDPSIVPTNTQALTKILSAYASFEKLSKKDGWLPADPPSRHVGILHKQQNWTHLPVLDALARQPHFRSDGVLVTQPGYDSYSKRFGVFDPRQFVVHANPTKEDAMVSLGLLRDLISEFRFAHPSDESTALSAMMTATVRPSLPFAPAYHYKAAVIGSGKSHLCEVTTGFAGPAESAKMSFPSTSEEATKAITAALLKKPAVLEFDDMTQDWIPHGVINRMLSTGQLTERILGASRTATVSTGTLVLSSGNNVGPVRDLLRRVCTVNLDPGCAVPATITYKGKPVETIRAQRGLYVSAVLTIIQAWKAAGSPRSNVSSIATYNGEWADYCRHPLIWLGLPDPATSLLEQVKHDPDGDALGALQIAWYEAFGTSAKTVRKAIEKTAYNCEDLKEAISEFPVVERDAINPGKLGWLLKKNVNCIVGGLKFVPALADGRKAWAIVVVDQNALTESRKPTKSEPTKLTPPADPLSEY
jgi:hypothetical protein